MRIVFSIMVLITGCSGGYYHYKITARGGEVYYSNRYPDISVIGQSVTFYKEGTDEWTTMEYEKIERKKVNE